MQHRKKKFDCLVIGGGHNGLIAAAYLGLAGKSVCVLERRDVLGGAATTEPLWPGYRVSTAAYVVSLLLPEIVHELQLKQHGFRVLPRCPSSFTPLLDGRHLVLGPQQSANQAAIARFSRRDADTYPRYQRFLERVAEVVEPILSEPAPEVLPLPDHWRARRWTKRLADTRRLWHVYQALGTLQDELPEAVELITGAATPILERWFETDVLRATLATDAIIGAMASPSMAGTAYVLLHHVMGRAGGERGIWGYVEGGMGRLADALASRCADLPVEIRRGCEVTKILVENGRVTGVQLADDRVVDGRAVASTVDAHVTFERLLEPSDLPEPFLAAVRRIDYGSASAKINLALGELPQFSCLGSDQRDQLRGTIHICPTMEYIERAYDDAKYGDPSREPVLEITIPSLVDPTIVPAGKHLMSIFVQYAPYRLRAGSSWDDIKESFADRCIEVIGRYAPNLPQAIEHRQVLSPWDLERTFGLTGGNIMQGAMWPHQLFSLRPVPGWADHRTPVRGLYLCGAASHPGGGVLGACGKNGAQAILRDL